MNNLHVVEGADHSFLITKTHLKVRVRCRRTLINESSVTSQTLVGGHTLASRYRRMQ
jgi:hypothetical protein